MNDSPLIAVVDVETTGLYWRLDRVIEVAALLMNVEGKIVDQYETLINPLRDIGPSRIHGIHSEEILLAPKFEEVAGDLLAILRRSSVLAGHNVRFDLGFLNSEFERVGVVMPEIESICTYEVLGRGSLKSCCETHNIEFDGSAHSASGDAMATARLLHNLIEDDPEIVASVRQFDIRWPAIEPSNTPRVTRKTARKSIESKPGLLQRIVGRIRRDTELSSSNLLAYLALLDRVLEDRMIAPEEEESLIKIAHDWGLSATEVEEAHWDYLKSLAMHALSDGVVSATEREDIHVVAKLLGFERSKLNELLDTAELLLQDARASVVQPIAKQTLAGQLVCFTGELESTLKGRPITRDIAQAIAEEAGLTVANSVTKKLDILVVADPHSQSTKAKKARQYGIRIVAEQVFWGMIGVTLD